MCPGCVWEWTHIWKRLVITYFIWLVMWFGNQWVSHLLDRTFSWLKEPVKRFIAGLIGAAAYSALAMIAIIWIIKVLFNIRIADDIGDNVLWAIFFSVLVLSVMLAREFLFAWRELTLREEKMKNEVLTSKFELLRNQVNPHFMFNSLNTLNSLIYQNQDLAAKYVNNLSNVYRSVLDVGKNEVITIEEELKMLKSYIFLQSIRFEGKFKVENRLDEATKKMHIPPMVLQMLIENAIKHNEITNEHPLHIELYNEGDLICVKNKIVLKETLPGDASNLGLKNIRSRYQMLSDTPVEILNDEVHFIVKLPLLTLE